MATGKVVKKGSSTIFWIIGGIIVVAGGIGAYFLLRKPKEEGQNDTDTDTDDDINNNLGRNNQGGGNIIRHTAPKELNTKSKIESFQNYVVNTKNDKAILGSAGVDGIWGRNTQNAWGKYGSDYLKTLNTSTTISSNPEFKRALNDAKNKNKTAFIWANQVYRTKTGERVMNYNPLIFNLITSRSGNLRINPNTTSNSIPIKAGFPLGKGTDVVYNQPYLFIKVKPVGSPTSMWIDSTLVERATSSSFTGVEENLEVLDGKFDLNI